jgi:hypothetical protein
MTKDARRLIMMMATVVAGMGVGQSVHAAPDPTADPDGAAIPPRRPPTPVHSDAVLDRMSSQTAACVRSTFLG